MSEQTQNTQQNEATKKQIKDLSSKGFISRLSLQD